MRKFGLITLTALLAGFAPMAFAMTATQTVEKEITRTAPDGSVTTERVEAKLVTPGEKVVYTLNIQNTRNEAASDLKLAMPIPADVKYIEGTADRPGAIVRFSADGGQTFTDRESLQVTETSGQARPATADDITHIQWQIAGPIAAGSGDSVEFKARLR